MAIINEKSNLPAICGRVCPHEKQCQGHCVLYPKGKGIEIGKLERFVADFDTEMKLIREKLPQKTRGKGCRDWFGTCRTDRSRRLGSSGF